MNVIERAVVLTKNTVLQPQDLPESYRQEDNHVDLVDGRLPGSNLKAALANPEKQLILDALNAHGWNRQETSDFLGINRTTLYKKMKRVRHQLREAIDGDVRLRVWG